VQRKRHGLGHRILQESRELAHQDARQFAAGRAPAHDLLAFSPAIPLSDLVQGKELGPYRILSELGSGGMGTVHSAEVAAVVAGLEVGQRVAVKVIHPHLLSTPGFFKRFLREAELGRKVVHENVVRTFDVDATQLEGKAVHFMVMEYVEGKSLRKLLLDLGTVPETLLREIALQTVAGLAAIHAQGIVHRDLKPENVLITDDHEIRIMDLGVAKLQEASIAITREGHFAGSVLYAAPEQFGPDEVGPSVDLYALGVMLFELATGDNPFRRDDVAAVIDAQLKLRPPRITDLNTDMTAFFAELVAALLAKKPADRFDSARLLHDVLAEAERSPWWVELAPRLEKRVAHLPRIRVRRETELHGRDGALDTLSEAWERAKKGEGNTVFIEGEAGIGKTRLLDAFLRGLDDKDIHVLYGSYPPSGGLGGFSSAIIGKFGEAGLAEALAPYLTITPSLVPAFAALIKHEGLPMGAEPVQGDGLNAVCVHLITLRPRTAGTPCWRWRVPAKAIASCWCRRPVPVCRTTRSPTSAAWRTSSVFRCTDSVRARSSSSWRMPSRAKRWPRSWGSGSRRSRTVSPSSSSR
jgi:serine/threonine protein kinase